MSTTTDLAARVAGLELAPGLAAQLTVRLERGAVEYGDRSLDRPRAELLGEMVEEALDLIGWALVLEAATQRYHGASCAVAIRHRLGPVVQRAGAIAGYLEHARLEALAIAAEGSR